MNVSIILSIIILIIILLIKISNMIVIYFLKNNMYYSNLKYYNKNFTNNINYKLTDVINNKIIYKTESDLIKTKYKKIIKNYKKLSNLPDTELIWDKILKKKRNMILNHYGNKVNLLLLLLVGWLIRTSVFTTDKTNNTMYIDNLEGYIYGIYGMTKEKENILRTGKNGKLIMSKDNSLPKIEDIQKYHPNFESNQTYILGLDNLNIFQRLFNEIFMKEHNLLCDELVNKYKNKTDEWYFIKSKLLVHFKLWYIIFNEYLLDFHVIPSFSKTKKNLFNFSNKFVNLLHYYKYSDKNKFAEVIPKNYIGSSLEFLLLYNWHSMIPGQINYKGDNINIEDFIKKENIENEDLLDCLLNNNCNNLTYQNTPLFLKHAEKSIILQSRNNDTPGLNEYRKLCNLPVYKSFEELTTNKYIQTTLKKLYSNIDNVELYIGFHVENKIDTKFVPETSVKILISNAYLFIIYILNDLFEEIKRENLLEFTKDVSLENIIKRNTKIKNLKQNLFFSD